MTRQARSLPCPFWSSVLGHRNMASFSEANGDYLQPDSARGCGGVGRRRCSEDGAAPDHRRSGSRPYCRRGGFAARSTAAALLYRRPPAADRRRDALARPGDTPASTCRLMAACRRFRADDDGCRPRPGAACRAEGVPKRAEMLTVSIRWRSISGAAPSSGALRDRRATIPAFTGKTAHRRVRRPAGPSFRRPVGRRMIRRS